MNKNIKINILKKEGEIEYIKKKEFLEINDMHHLFKYIKFIKKIKNLNIERLLKNVNNIIFEMSIENIDLTNMKVIVNNYYKNIKKYKMHILLFKKYNDYGKYITKFYEKTFENNGIINTIRYIFHLLYNEKILSNKDILDWYHNLNKNSIYVSSDILKDFIEWLEDQSSSEYEDNEDNENDYSD